MNKKQGSGGGPDKGLYLLHLLQGLVSVQQVLVPVAQRVHCLLIQLQEHRNRLLQKAVHSGQLQDKGMILTRVYPVLKGFSQIRYCCRIQSESTIEKTLLSAVTYSGYIYIHGIQIQYSKSRRLVMNSKLHDVMQLQTLLPSSEEGFSPNSSHFIMKHFSRSGQVFSRKLVKPRRYLLDTLPPYLLRQAGLLLRCPREQTRRC